MSDLQKGMLILISTFHKYACAEGDKTSLSKGEVKELLNKELGNMFSDCKDQAALDKLFKDLDANADSKVDFQEFVTLVACLTMLCNKAFTQKK
ncbi:Ictacalcin [Bagarius yarrelli]|uniref:Ictacalcin n=1 Tax=Bagarius yarrelli TaxID=175774 RepID=A0A556V939_BAGYA|nr:Ictacalcin [Bagarius yarrelli]